MRADRPTLALSLIVAAFVLAHLPAAPLLCGVELRGSASLFTLASNACCIAAVWIATSRAERRPAWAWPLLLVAGLTGVAGLALVGVVSIVIGWTRGARSAQRRRGASA